MRTFQQTRVENIPLYDDEIQRIYDYWIEAQKEFCENFVLAEGVQMWYDEYHDMNVTWETAEKIAAAILTQLKGEI